MDFMNKLQSVLFSESARTNSDLDLAREMFSAGDEELAAIVALEDAPLALSIDFVHEMDRYFKHSGRYGEAEAITAIRRYHSLSRA